MGRQQARLLVCSATAIALLASSLFVLAWFRIELMGSSIEIDLSSANLCNAMSACTSIALSKMKGLYPATATVSFYAGLLLLLVVIVQSASKLVTGAVHDRITRIGYILAVATVVCGFSAGYLFGPDGSGMASQIVSITVERTWAPFAFLVGTLASFAALYYASSEAVTDDVAAYKPVHIEKRLPVTPLSNKAVTMPSQSIPLEGSGRPSRPGSSPGLDRRPTTPSGGLRTEDLRSKTSSTSPPLGGRSMTPGGTFLRTDAQGRTVTPSGGFARTDAEGRSLTPSGGFNRTDAHTPSDGFVRIDDRRARPPTEPPVVRIDEPRSRPPTQPPPDQGRTKTKSQPPFVARTTSPSGIADPTQQRTRASSPGLNDLTRGKSPSQQPFVARTTSPSGIADPTRNKSPSQQPFVARTTSPSGISDPTRSKSPSQSHIDPVVRSRTSSSGPIDLAARLSASVQSPLDGASNLAVSIRPPLPTPEPVPHDQIPVDPAAGLTIRKRTASASPQSELTLAPVTAPAPAEPLVPAPAPTLPDDAFGPPIAIPTPPESGLLIRQRRPSAVPPGEKAPGDDTMPRITVDGLEKLAEALTTATKLPELPDYIRGKIRFAVLTAELASAGLKARREDGLEKLVKWDEVVGIVARRLPADKPFEGATVVDLLSTAGATLRIVPWTRIEGHPFESKAVERARSFVNVVAAMALDAKLDSATKTFANGDGDAAQLPDVAALATHDSKVG